MTSEVRERLEAAERDARDVEARRVAREAEQAAAARQRRAEQLSRLLQRILGLEVAWERVRHEDVNGEVLTTVEVDGLKFASRLVDGALFAIAPCVTCPKVLASASVYSQNHREDAWGVFARAVVDPKLWYETRTGDAHACSRLAFFVVDADGNHRMLRAQDSGAAVHEALAVMGLRIERAPYVPIERLEAKQAKLPQYAQPDPEAGET